ncbi:MAG: ABC transporter permease [Pseudomonadota bacterium]
MRLWRLALASLRSRALTVGLTVTAIALSVALFLGVEKIRTGARVSFADTISGTDLIVGARTGGVQLLLYSVFRIGAATNNITWESYEDVIARPEVDWAVPISLGDSHRQFRVMGTTEAFFERYRYRGGRALEMAEGALMADLFDAVVGADVARARSYAVGDPIIVSHGLSSFVDHEDTPFRISGVLAKTGTPVDRTVIVSLEAIEAIHVDWQGGAFDGTATPVEEIRRMDLRPQAITAALIGVNSKLRIFTLQRAVNDYPREPLMAILPGVALQELWAIVGVAETALVAVSGLVIATSLLGMGAMLLAGLEARRREMAILRALGAGPATIAGLLVAEAALMAATGAALGTAMLYAALALGRPAVDAAFGLWLPLTPPTGWELSVLGAVVLGAAVTALLPAVRAYRLSLAGGMMVKT